MASDTQTAGLDVRELLEAACARNLSAELHYEEDDELRRARMRLLSIVNETIHVDKPLSIGKPFTLRPRQRITVYFVYESNSYAFKSQIIGPIIVTDLNECKRVRGAVLRMPKSIAEEQRRHDFRLSLSKEEIVATFHSLDPHHTDRAPIDAMRCEGRIINLSGGGLALMMKTVPGRKFRINDQFCIAFDLPQVAARIALPVELRGVRRIHDGVNTILGFQFAGKHLPENRSLVQQIRKYIADEQRSQLRQMRGD